MAGGPICEKRDKRLIPITEEKVFPGETERLIEGIYAVSYTHLDVYKRQVHAGGDPCDPRQKVCVMK